LNGGKDIIMRKEALGTFLALLTAVISGFAIPVNKIFVVDLDPVVFTAIRALAIGIIFFIISSAKGGFSRGRHGIPWKWLFLIGIIGGGLAFLLYFTGLGFTTAGRAAFLHKTLPVYVTVFAFIFLREKVSRRQGLALLVMLIGTFVLLSSQIGPAAFWTDPSFGDLMVLLGTILWGIESTMARHVMLRGGSSWIVAFARMFIGGVFLLAVAAFMGKAWMFLALTPQQAVNLMISMAMLFGYVFTWYWSIKLINVSKAAAILLLSPVISLAVGSLAFGEPVPLLQLAGSALILIGAAFVMRIKSELVTGV
jgi:drug/metabolite transporter (DMT)-like permease